jgi:hypothetical protein
MVLSDRKGELQAFAHDGDLSSADLGRWLTYGADPNLVVRTTMSNASSRSSMYPPTAYGPAGNAGYMMYGTYPGYVSSGSMFIGSSCPGGNCYRR